MSISLPTVLPPDMIETRCSVCLWPHPLPPGEPTTTEFQLSDQVFARARIASPASVNLWLGANVMVVRKRGNEVGYEVLRCLEETYLRVFVL